MELKTIRLYGKPLFTLVKIPEPVRFPTPMPTDEAAFVYILEGHCTNVSELECFDLKEGQGILAKSGDSIFQTHAMDDSGLFRSLSIRFHREILEKLYENEPVPFFKNQKADLSTNSVMVHPNTILKHYINGIEGYFDVKDQIDEALLILKLKELVALLMRNRNSKGINEIMSNLFESKSFEFKEVIKAHVFSPISIKELAQLTNNSLSSFKKEFKRLYDDTPNNYIINKRIEKVAMLLKDSDESLTNIALDCEFKTLSHMSRVFKNKYGISPSAYRSGLSGKK